MQIRAFRFVAVLGCLAAIESGATGLSVGDGCATVSGQATGAPTALTVAADGSVTVNPFVANSGNYVAGLGMCDALQGKPTCTISASATRVAKNSTVQLFARCPAGTSSFAWTGPAGATVGPNGPGVPAAATSTPSLTLLFPSAGTYSYTVTGTASGNTGFSSAPVTIIVADSGATPDVPYCVVSASPANTVMTGSTFLAASCEPENVTQYQWTVDAGAPTPPTGASATVTFPSFGTYTYKMTPTNAVGAGPTSSVTVFVQGPTLVNGSFETPTITGNSVTPMNNPPWTSTHGASTNTATIAKQGFTFSHLPAPPDGNQAIGYPYDGSVSQTLTLAAGSYHLSFRALTNPVNQFTGLTVAVDGAGIMGMANTSTSSWDSFNIAFTIRTTGSHTITFKSNPNAGSGTIYLDNVQILP